MTRTPGLLPLAGARDFEILSQCKMPRLHNLASSALRPLSLWVACWQSYTGHNPPDGSTSLEATTLCRSTRIAINLGQCFLLRLLIYVASATSVG